MNLLFFLQAFTCDDDTSMQGHAILYPITVEDNGQITGIQYDLGLLIHWEIEK